MDNFRKMQSGEPPNHEIAREIIVDYCGFSTAAAGEILALRDRNLIEFYRQFGTDEGRPYLAYITLQKEVSKLVAMPVAVAKVLDSGASAKFIEIVVVYKDYYKKFREVIAKSMRGFFANVAGAAFDELVKKLVFAMQEMDARPGSEFVLDPMYSDRMIRSRFVPTATDTIFNLPKLQTKFVLGGSDDELAAFARIPQKYLPIGIGSLFIFCSKHRKDNHTSIAQITRTANNKAAVVCMVGSGDVEGVNRPVFLAESFPAGDKIALISTAKGLTRLSLESMEGVIGRETLILEPFQSVAVMAV
ncbi:MAG: hypothetical protein LBB38_01720 [Puniceicoccales bacterium]|nr:hypothetical protein [Puniceicoccales bacterium]